MALVRNTNASALAGQAIVLDLRDLARQGDALVAAAREEAARIVAGAKAERRALIESAAAEGTRRGIEEGIKVGRAAGAESGRKEALAASRKACDALAAQWSAALAAMEHERARTMRTAREELIGLALSIAEKVIGRTIDADPSVYEHLLEAAIGQVAAPGAVEVRINPEDRPTIEGMLPAVCAKFSKSEASTIVDDGTLARGSIVVRANQGEFDASIGTQIQRIAEVLAPGRPALGPGGGPGGRPS